MEADFSIWLLRWQVEGKKLNFPIEKFDNHDFLDFLNASESPDHLFTHLSRQLMIVQIISTDSIYHQTHQVGNALSLEFHDTIANLVNIFFIFLFGTPASWWVLTIKKKLDSRLISSQQYISIPRYILNHREQSFELLLFIITELT